MTVKVAELADVTTAIAKITLKVGTVTTLPPGSAATATITGTAPAFVLDLGIPEGQRGKTGKEGPPAPNGPVFPGAGLFPGGAN